MNQNNREIDNQMRTKIILLSSNNRKRFFFKTYIKKKEKKKRNIFSHLEEVIFECMVASAASWGAPDSVIHAVLRQHSYTWSGSV